MSSQEFFLQMSKRCQLTASEPDFVRAFTRIFQPIPEIHCLVHTLKPRLKLGLLSNTNEWHYQHGIRPVEVFPLFDTITLSFEVKAMKPKRAIYEDALAKLHEPPGSCIYIDDLKENVDAAANLGFHAIHFVGHKQLMESLRSLGVLVNQ